MKIRRRRRAREVDLRGREVVANEGERALRGSRREEVFENRRTAFAASVRDLEHRVFAEDAAELFLPAAIARDVVGRLELAYLLAGR